jgi:hypothetical protein
MAYNATVTDAALATLTAAIAENTAADATQQSDLDVLWLLFGAYLVFFMQVSFPKP